MSDWQKEWQRIESIIRSMELSLPDYDADCKEIEDRLDRGEYVEHHSKVFEESYSPHYRIISRQIFEKELRPNVRTFSVRMIYSAVFRNIYILFVFRLLEVKLEIKSVVHHPQIGKLLQFATVFLGRTA